MSTTGVSRGSGWGSALVLPGAVLVGLIGLIGVQTGTLQLPRFASGDTIAPETVIVPPHAYSYRATGEFQRGVVEVDGPLRFVAAGGSLEIMTYEVSESDYARCVADGDCHRAEPRRRGQGNVPVTSVSFDDANDYAVWLSGSTGDIWRLPTVEEWTFAAGTKAVDQALGHDTDPASPAARWLAYYEKEARLGANGLRTPGPLGSGGFNEYGVADLSAAVWEWTSTCGGRTTLAPDGEVILSHLRSCGVRYLEGAHRTTVSKFIRDAQSGGCSVGAPPDNLGFRLIRERPWYVALFDATTRWIGNSDFRSG